MSEKRGVWIESEKGNFHPFVFNSTKKVSKKEIEKAIRKEFPSCGMIVFPNQQESKTVKLGKVKVKAKRAAVDRDIERMGVKF